MFGDTIASLKLSQAKAMVKWITFGHKQPFVMPNGNFVIGRAIDQSIQTVRRYVSRIRPECQDQRRILVSGSNSATSWGWAEGIEKGRIVERCGWSRRSNFTVNTNHRVESTGTVETRGGKVIPEGRKLHITIGCLVLRKCPNNAPDITPLTGARNTHTK